MSGPVSPLALRSFALAIAVTAFAWPVAANAQGKKKNPASKMYVTDVSGDAQIDTGETVQDVTKRSVYNAEGSVIDTKAPTNPNDKHFSTIVYSNGTGAYFDADTRVEIRKFVQEPFLPTRTDSEVEPSISQTQAFVARGAVGLCTSKLVAGSTMSYATPHGSVLVRGQKVVIQTSEKQTTISMLEGESTVRAGAMDMGGHTLHAGEQAIIRPTTPGQPNQIDIGPIPSAEVPQLDEKVTMACMAKKTVYFEVRARQTTNASATNGSEVTVFNGNTNTTRSAGDPFTNSNGEIIAVPVVPANLPVQYTVSPASLTPGTTGGPGG